MKKTLKESPKILGLDVSTRTIGIALFECESNAVSYILYDIKNGKNDLIIKEIPINEVRNFIKL